MAEDHIRKGGFPLNTSCNIILDLIPLVKDGVASEESQALVHEHIKTCASCKEEYDLFTVVTPDYTHIEDEKIIRTIKRSVFHTQIVVLIIGGIIGVALTNTMGLFYNLIIMPIIGGIGYLALKRYWFWVPVGIFVLFSLYQIITSIFKIELNWLYVSGIFLYSLIFSGLVVLGVIITWLFIYAFKKEGN